MKRFACFTFALVLFAAPMFGSSKKPQTVVIPQNVTVGSTQVSAGTYKLAWTGTEPQVQATLTTKNGKTVATFAAKVIDAKNNNSGVELVTNGGVTNLKGILLENVSLTIESTQKAGE